MKKLLFLLFIFLVVLLFGCGGAKDDPAPNEHENDPTLVEVDPEPSNEPGKEDEAVDPFLGFDKEYNLIEGDSIDFGELYKGKLDDFSLSASSNIVEINGKVVLAKSSGEVKIVVISNDDTLVITLNISDKKDFSLNDIELFVLEEVELPITLSKCSLSDLEIKVNNDNIIIENNKIKGVRPGETILSVTLGSVTKTCKVVTKEIKVTVKNENLTLDCLETLALELDYPKGLVDANEINYYLYKSGIIEIKDNTIYPIKEGKVKVRVQVGDNKDTSSVFEVNVTIDPIAIIKSLHQENALMLKEIRLYGEDSNGKPAYVSQEFLGSVSYYFFAPLNLIEQIIDIYDNPYVGEVATPEIINQIDKKKNKECPGYPRSGVLLTGINYITYHDTGNFNAGAKSQSNANWMTNSYSIAATARSWHYTVDEDQVIHSIPDNEVTFQGDHYTAYTESIGIETCVNQGANLDKVWHRMGKLCARLMAKYSIDVDHIKQHYDWMGKNCPQTLRMNGLYSYAISMVKAELVVKKYLSDYKIEFESLNPEYVDETGQVIKAPTEEIMVGYKVTISNDSGYNESVILYTTISPLK